MAEIKRLRKQFLCDHDCQICLLYDFEEQQCFVDGLFKDTFSKGSIITITVEEPEK